MTDDTKKTMMKKELDEIIRRVNLLRARFDRLEKYLAEAQVSLKGSTQEEEDENGSVVCVLPHIKAKYERVSKTGLPYMELVFLFENWTTEYTQALFKNKHRVKHPAVARHMADVLNVLKIVDFATKEYFNR